MRLRFLQHRLAKLERLVGRQAAADQQFDIDQAAADRYVELKTSYQRQLEEHKPWRPFEKQQLHEMFKEMCEIRNSHNPPGSDMRLEIWGRRNFLETRRDDSNYIPLSPKEEAQLRQLILLGEIQIRDILNEGRPEFLVPWHIQRLGYAQNTDPKDDRTREESDEDEKKLMLALGWLVKEVDEGIRTGQQDRVSARWNARLERFRKK